MTTHLNDERISKWIAGASTAEEQQHCRECAQCRASINSFQDDLSRFGGAIAHWADQQRVSAIPDVQRMTGIWHQVRMRSLRWVAVAAAVTIVAGFPAYKKSMEREREVQAAQESQLDDQLLERVNAHLSRTAPVSLQPLMEMLPNRNGTKDIRKEGDR
jgi:ABC-type uncharacterized transport system YnjBCD ATPase subunit